ncbi:MAG: patatin-like phospholipase family protein [Pseudomonadota bacterium]
MTLRPLSHLDITRVETLAFAGGGNRCWWQAGAISHLLQQGWKLPPQLVGTSAGAGVAASCITDGPKAALDACLRLYGANSHLFEWKGLARLRIRFAHQHIYPSWIASFVNSGNFASLQTSGTRLRVALTRPAPALGLAGSIAAGTVAYVIDKHLWNSIHPRLPRLFGLRQDFADLHQCHTFAEAQALLGAAAAAPPFMRSQRIGGVAAIDGGYTDNAPIHPQSEQEKSRTLVLLTRYYPRLPQLFHWLGRTYWQPSQRVPVSTWDCRANTTVEAAFALGERDARQVF